METISPETKMDAVTLRVGDLERMSAYYEGALALTPFEERVRGREVLRVLGRGTTPMVRLIHTPDLPRVDPHQAGLFHTAFLFDDAGSLAATVYRASQCAESRFVGASDHLVSEAFYFTDPEGNGIELYTDRPHEQWTYVNGAIEMATNHLDANAYLQAHLTQDVVDAAPGLAGRVGHVHLQVGDIQVARAFYVDGLGFEPTATGYPGALFAAAGGYHHHVAMNTWNSSGVGPRAASLGLGAVAVSVPTRDALDALAARLKARNIPFTADGRAVKVEDPWGTQISVAVTGLTTDELLT